MSPEKLQKKLRRLKRKLAIVHSQYARQMEEQRQKEHYRTQVFLKTLNVIQPSYDTHDLYQEYFNKPS